MIRYFAASGGLHTLAVVLLVLVLSPASNKPQATYTIDFIGSGKVQAVQAAPEQQAKTAVAAPAPAKTAVPKAEPEKPKAPAKKAYTAKAEISDKPAPAKPKTAVEEPLAAPSILEEGEDKNAATQEGEKQEFGGGNIQTDFANFPYPWYITQVRNSMWSEWEKRRPAGHTLSAMVTFAIARDGKIKDLKVERKSGDDSFDFAATSSVINAGPFAPLPMYYEKDELTVTVEFKQET